MRLTLLVILFTSFAVSAQTYSEYIDLVDKAVANRDYARIIVLYDSIFAKFKPRGIDLYNAACAHSLRGNLPKSIQLLKRSFESGFSNFDLMYYDRDLQPIRYDPAYLALEKKYRPDSVVFFFEILRQLNESSDELEICDKRISLTEDRLFAYSLDDIKYRVGIDLKVTSDSLFDFSTRRLKICRSRFDDNDDSFNTLERMSLRELAIEDSKGLVVLAHLRLKHLWVNEAAGNENFLKRIIIDDVTTNGLVHVECNGADFTCKNSTFNVDVPAHESFRWGFYWGLDYDEIRISNTTFNSTQQVGPLYPLEFDLKKVEKLIIEGSKFNYDARFYGSVANVFSVRSNSFPAHFDMTRLNLPDFDCYFPFSQLSNSRLVRFDYQGNRYIPQSDSTIEYSDDVLYDDLTALYKRLYDHYRSRADISSANRVYVIMKELEIAHLKQIEHRGSEETIRLRLNQLMGFYTDHATSPGKAIIISFYIILAFGLFYCFFPSDWDKTSKTQVVSDFRLFIEKNEHGYVKPFFKMMKGLLISLLNAVTLSMNAFITLGFGNIPTAGVARYMCIFQGVVGWFLLSLFTVALLNQVLL